MHLGRSFGRICRSLASFFVEVTAYMIRRKLNSLIFIGVLLAIAIYIVIPNSPGIHIGSIQKDFVTQLGLDLIGGAQALLEADLPPGTPVDPEAMDTAARIVENRVNGFGVAEAVVQRAGENRVVVELPGVTDPEQVLASVQQTGLLEFVDFSMLSPVQINQLEQSQAEIQTDFALKQAGQQAPVITDTQVISPTAAIYPTIMTGKDLKLVRVQQNPNTAEYQIAFELSDEGTKIFREFTSQHIGDVLAIVLDKRIISAPVINDAITDGRGVISGNFTYDSANALAINLRYGSLPIPLKVVEIRTVGPTLGQDSLRKSLVAGAIGFTIIMLFMVLYYRLPGIVADLALVIYALITFAIFRFIPVTLTLPGIAGFLLSTGSALDANILIFERLKEELRGGRPLQQAVVMGWQRAWPSIRDSNIATLITSTILFWFGSAFGATIVKGFSVTLALGVGVSLLTALLITRTLLEVVLSFYKSKNYERWFGL